MRPAIRLVALMLLSCLIGAGRAEAGLWDMIDALDGPGPSSGTGNIMVNLVCSDAGGARAGDPFRTRLKSGTLRIPDDAGKGSCLFFDWRSFEAKEDDRFYPVNLDITEFGASARLHPTVELGGGIGWLSFNSRFPGASDDITGTRLTISFPRVTFKPLMAIPFKPFNNSRGGWGFLQLYFRETIVVGNLTDEDFATKPGNDFSRDDQRISSMGFIIDATTVLRLAGLR